MSTRAKRSRTTQTSAPAATPAPLQWTGQMHHIFFTVVLPTVFEWCALSDFFMPDELFHTYRQEANGSATTRGPFSVAHAVCKDWFAALYMRVYAHPFRVDYDMRLLRSNTGGIMHNGQVMLRMWKTADQLQYLRHGGTPVSEAYKSGVELYYTTKHNLLYKKLFTFLRCQALQVISEPALLSLLPLEDCLPTIQMRRVQIQGPCHASWCNIGKILLFDKIVWPKGSFAYIHFEQKNSRTPWKVLIQGPDGK